MTFGQRMSLTAVPLVLRVVLGVVFVWAGYAKLFSSTEYGPEQIGVLVELGVLPPDALPVGGPEPAPGEALPAEADAPGGDAVPEGAPETGEPAQAPAGEEDGAAPADTGEPAGSGGAVIVPIAAAGSAPGTGAPAQTRRLRRVHDVAILLYARSHPDSGAPLWPSRLSSPGMILALAWALALTEFLGGLLLAAGFLTRLWGAAFVAAMLVAMLLTTIGPATQAPDSLLGFLPALRLGEPGSAWIAAWQTWLFQLVVGAGSLCLVLTGAGPVSVDALVFRRTIVRRRAARGEAAAEAGADS